MHIDTHYVSQGGNPVYSPREDAQKRWLMVFGRKSKKGSGACAHVCPLFHNTFLRGWNTWGQLESSSPPFIVSKVRPFAPDAFLQMSGLSADAMLYSLVVSSGPSMLSKSVSCIYLTESLRQLYLSLWSYTHSTYLELPFTMCRCRSRSGGYHEKKSTLK